MITKVTNELYFSDHSDAKLASESGQFDWIITVAQYSPFHGDIIFRLIDGELAPNKPLTGKEAEKQKALFKQVISLLGEIDFPKTKILVHCNAGISRSSSVCIGYLMRYQDISYDEAYNRVKALKPNINPHPFFVDILQNDEYFKGDVW